MAALPVQSYLGLFDSDGLDRILRRIRASDGQEFSHTVESRDSDLVQLEVYPRVAWSVRSLV